MLALTPATGGCNCSKLRYKMTKEPVACYICHCHQCQKRTGSAFSMSVIMPADGLQIELGEPVASARGLPDGATSRSYTCAACHSRLYTRKDGSHTLNLRAGTLDNTHYVRPIAQIWTSSAQPWAIQSGILSYPEQTLDYRPWLEAWKLLR